MREQKITTEEVQKSIRYRVNTAISVKGVITWDATGDMTGYSMEDVLSESDKLVKELKSRYPITFEAVNK